MFFFCCASHSGIRDASSGFFMGKQLKIIYYTMLGKWPGRAHLRGGWYLPLPPINFVPSLPTHSPTRTGLSMSEWIDGCAQEPCLSGWNTSAEPVLLHTWGDRCCELTQDTESGGHMQSRSFFLVPAQKHNFSNRLQLFSALQKRSCNIQTAEHVSLSWINNKCHPNRYYHYAMCLPRSTYITTIRM